MEGTAVILAAGKGTRMHSSRIKVLHDILGVPMVAWPIQIAQSVGLSPLLVVGHQETEVREALADKDIHFARQPIPKGTGDAVRCALTELPETGRMVVMAGDAPLFRRETLEKLMSAHGDSYVTVLTAVIDEPGSYGRIIRDDACQPLRITEAAEATPEEKEITEINTGVYVFDVAWLRSVLPDFQPHPPKNEIYLTDAVELAAQLGKAQAVVLDDPREADGVNDRWALAEATRRLQMRVIQAHAMAGVTFEDPHSNTVECFVSLDQDVTIERGAILRGNTRVGANSRIGAYTVLCHTKVANDVHIKPHTHSESAVIGTGSVVGPFARLREGTQLDRQVKVGNFVETKKAHFHAGAKASHLSYIGDATIGEAANIGAGTITCNYDGFSKFKTKVGAGAFIGSNTALVAPVDIGADSIVGAGSVISKKVPSGSIALTRSPQETLEGGAIRFREKRVRNQSSPSSDKGRST